MGYLFYGILIILLLLSFLFFDLIIRRQYYEHHKSWIKDGKLPGMFFFPKESFHLFSGFGKSRYMSKILIETPYWMEYDKRAKRLLVFYRFTVVAYILIFLSPLLIYFLGDK